MPGKKKDRKNLGTLQTKVLPEHYFDVFQRNPSGLLVFEELWLNFADRTSHVPGDSHSTAFQEGQRAVLLFIAKKCAEAQQ